MADASYYGRSSAASSSSLQAVVPSSASAVSPLQTSSSNADAHQQGRLFVGGLSWQTTEESLRWHFEQYGQVASVELMRDRNTGQPRGFGFVVFASASSVDLVMETPVHEINHKVVDVKRAQARGVAPPSIHQDPSHQLYKAAASPRYGAANTLTRPEMNEASNAPVVSNDGSKEMNKVFVGGLPHEIDRDALKDIFSEFGQITDAIVMIDQATSRSRGFGFVSFENGSMGAEHAVEAQPLMILNKRVEVKFATPRDAQFNKKRVLPAVPKHLGLRAGQSVSSSSGEFAGLAVAYGRTGWKAGYGSRAFGADGWKVKGWDQGGLPPERSGFSFAMRQNDSRTTLGPPTKRAKH